ncbi:bifunctional alpha,alpha-trehalose-phosphate synthase (UDP-forming)/trehalose-phosphatase [bacterium]|nr:bifunctional alpha,alpha-trehalose-phosphate synthase (UDP-forming)/trehalose-phosphatase [bacterium]
MGRLLLISNRLPVTIDKRKGKFSFKPSVGGLATGLSSFHDNMESHWIGWCGIASNQMDAGKKRELHIVLKNKFKSSPVHLTRQDIRMFYAGFCNKTIWPLFHYFPNHASYINQQWDSYVHVNKLFAQAVFKEAQHDDIIWVHDYHLFLLPQMLRQKLPHAHIGFFLHIPFPSYEIFRLLPWREEILEGILGADLIGFHTYDYVRHFDSSVRRILGHEHTLGQINTGQRMVRVDAFPMGIDYKRFQNAEINEALYSEILSNCCIENECRIILSVDRLDYTKGIPERLKAFDRFLDKYTQYRGSVTLLLVAVPSRTTVESYVALKRQVDELVGRINGKHSTPGWTPVRYYYRSFPFRDLASLYHLSDVALVTPLRDGMNLIAKEYIASRKNDRGVLILSEMAGAVSEMGEALIINPQNMEQVADAIYTALIMPVDEQISRNRLMKIRLKKYNVTAWGEDFIDRLGDVKTDQDEIQAKQITEGNRATLIRKYRTACRRLFLLDYDGTLTPFVNKPDKAAPDTEIVTLLKRLTAIPENNVVIISGRDRDTLGRWFENIPVALSAEHGIWTKDFDQDWHMLEHMNSEWKEMIRPILELFANRTPGAFMEEKPYSLVWHYRNTSIEMGNVRTRELKEELLHLTTNLNLQVMEGNKVLEIKNTNIHKGRAAQHFYSQGHWDFIIAIGDDHTDEYIFNELPENAYSIKVGLDKTKARYYLRDSHDVRSLLRAMVHHEAVTQNAD